MEGVQSGSPKVIPLPALPAEDGDWLSEFALANYYNKLVILTGGNDVNSTL